MPKALKSCPKSDKSPDLVTLLASPLLTYLPTTFIMFPTKNPKRFFKSKSICSCQTLMAFCLPTYRSLSTNYLYLPFFAFYTYLPIYLPTYTFRLFLNLSTSFFLSLSLSLSLFLFIYYIHSFSNFLSVRTSSCLFLFSSIQNVLSSSAKAINIFL